MDPEERAANRERMRQTSEGILQRIRTSAPAVLALFPVQAAYVFGSVARGTAQPDSDVDVALLLTEAGPEDAYQRLKLEVAIQAAMEDASGFSPVDVRAINHAPLMVRGTIVTEGVLIYERDKDRRVAFEVYTRSRYFDFLPFAQRQDEAFLKRIREEGIFFPDQPSEGKPPAAE